MGGRLTTAGLEFDFFIFMGDREGYDQNPASLLLLTCYSCQRIFANLTDTIIILLAPSKSLEYS